MLSKRHLIIAAITTFAFLLMTSVIDIANANRRRRPAASSPQKACTWANSDKLECWPFLVSTGCVGIKNKTEGELAFVVKTGSGEYWVHLGPHQERKADFAGKLEVFSCYKGPGGSRPDNMQKTNCQNVLEFTKNVDRGGGCGCENFGCIK